MLQIYRYTSSKIYLFINTLKQKLHKRKVLLHYEFLSGKFADL